MTTMPLPTPAMVLSELGLPPALSTVPVTGGADTQIWRVSLLVGDFALRLLRPDQRASAVRERVAMDVARAAGLPAPGVRAVGEVIGHAVLLLDWLPGETLRQALYETPLRTWRFGYAFGLTQAHIHQIPAPVGVIRPEGSWINWAGPDPELAALLRRHARAEAMLLHLDYHPGNVLVQGSVISGVLDWTNVNGGDPRADVARTGAILRFLPGNPDWSSERNAHVRRLLLAGWQQGYRQIAGALTSMAPFYAWAGTLMQRDLAPRLGRPDLPWLTETWMNRVQCWTDTWRASAVRA